MPYQKKIRNEENFTQPGDYCTPQGELVPITPEQGQLETDYCNLLGELSADQYEKEKKQAYEDYYRLTEMQKKFIENYLRSGNIAKSARLAGYSKANAASCGQDLMRKPKVQRIIEVKRRELSSVYQLSKEKLVSELEQIKEKAKDGNKTSLQMRCIEMQAKLLGHFQEASPANNIMTETNVHITMGGRKYNPDKPLSKDYDNDDDAIDTDYEDVEDLSADESDELPDGFETDDDN